MYSMKDVFIHPLAIVEEGVTIGSGTKVWINSQIREKASIGENCVISKDTFIDSGVTIGNGVKIQNSVSIYQGVSIADDVFVGPNACFTNDYIPRAFNKEWEVTNTIVERGVSIGANSTIVCGLTLGEYSMVGAGSVVTRDVPPYTLVVGNPARIVGKICKCGTRLNDGICPSCGGTQEGS